MKTKKINLKIDKEVINSLAGLEMNLLRGGDNWEDREEERPQTRICETGDCGVVSDLECDSIFHIVCNTTILESVCVECVGEV
jgi:hypothetical protein